MKNVKLIVSDMDGTLLDGKGNLPPEFFGLLDRLYEHGLRFVAASGRQYPSLYKHFEPVIDEMAFIAENGSLIMDKGKALHRWPMNRETALEIVRILKELGDRYIVVCSNDIAYIDTTDPKFMDAFVQHYDRYEVLEDVRQVPPGEILKVTVCDLSGAEENTLPHVKHLRENLNVKLSGDIWVDFTHCDAQKGNALVKVQELFGISEVETMVFGDYLNDLEMFDHCKYGYAMANAHEEVKAKAPFQARTNEEHGVMLVLQELLETLEA